MSPTPLRLALVACAGLAAAPALAQVSAPPRPPMWEETLRVAGPDHAVVEQALREAEAAVREAMRAVEHEIRALDLHAAPPARGGRPEARWMARSWAESQESRQGPEKTERIARSFKVGPSGQLALSNVSGDITIQAGQGDTINVEAIKRTRGADAADQFARTQVDMTERAGRVEVRVNYTGERNHASVDFNVTAPADTSLAIRSVSGDVRITGIHGDVRAESVSGDLYGVDVRGATLLKSVSGNVNVSAVTHEGELRGESVSGDVVVRDAQVRSLAAESVSGEITLANVTSERVGAKTVSGGVQFAGPLVQSGRYEMKSHSGDVRVTVANDAGFELEANTFSGNIRSDLPLTMGGPGREAVRTGHGAGRQALRGVYGDGSAYLSLASFSGSIVVGKK
ncbi:MAG: hypothetical protein H6Q10_1142 [Acidobacteria bacterium]|nr:hypothetical protein [Acidobacteriota bacterium]